MNSQTDFLKWVPRTVLPKETRRHKSLFHEQRIRGTGTFSADLHTTGIDCLAPCCALLFSITVSAVELVWKHCNILVQPEFNKMVNIPLVNLPVYIPKVIREHVKSTSHAQRQSMLGKEHPSTDTESESTRK